MVKQMSLAVLLSAALMVPALADGHTHLTKGSTWTLETSSVTEHATSKTTQVYTVNDVVDGVAKVSIKTTSVSVVQGNEYPGGETTMDMDMPIPAEAAETTEGTTETPEAEVEVTTETVETPAGTFECTKVESEAAGTKSVVFMHPDYSGLVVKSESTGPHGTTTQTLTALDVK